MSNAATAEMPNAGPFPQREKTKKPALPAGRRLRFQPQSKSGKLVVLCPAPLHAAPASGDPQSLAMLHQMTAVKLAVSLLRRWGASVCSEEVRSISSLALCEAAKAFDPGRGAKFETFLYYFVKGHLIRHITAQADASRMFTPLEFVGGSAEEGDGRRQESDRALISGQPTAEEALGRRRLYAFCEKACESLDELEREILTRRYFKGQCLKEVADALSFSRGHLSRVHSRAIATLRSRLVAVGALERGEIPECPLSSVDGDRILVKRRRRRR